MPDPATVKRALRALATDAVEPKDAIIDRAATAVDDIDRTGTFVDRHGIESLERAIEVAERRGDRERTRRGQRALAAFEWFRRAARGSSDADGIPLREKG